MSKLGNVGKIKRLVDTSGIVMLGFKTNTAPVSGVSRNTKSNTHTERFNKSQSKRDKEKSGHGIG